MQRRERSRECSQMDRARTGARRMAKRQWGAARVASNVDASPLPSELGMACRNDGSLNPGIAPKEKGIGRKKELVGEQKPEIEA
jgi:hypothetical protein